jgi:hypothetical protein
VRLLCCSLAFCALCFFWAPGTCWAAVPETPTSAEQSSVPASTEPPLLQPTPSWSSFDSILNELGIEASALSEESRALLRELETSRTEAHELSLSLKRCEKRLEDSESLRRRERLEADLALKAALSEGRQRAELWRTLALSAAGALGGYLAGGPTGAVVGAGVGGGISGVIIFLDY